MKFTHIIIYLLFISALIGCDKEKIIYPKSGQAPFEFTICDPHTLVIRLTDSLSRQIESNEDKQSAIKESTTLKFIDDNLGIESYERYFPYAGKYEERTKREGLHQWYIFTLKKDINDIKKETKSINELPGIEDIEVSYPIQKMHFNDPFLEKQWGYKNNGTLDISHISGIDINVEWVWKYFTSGKKEISNFPIIVAVIDGGIDQEHEDLKNNCIGGWNFIKNSNELIPDNHGTHVAGIIGAINNNNIGGCGIAGGNAIEEISGVQLLSCQIFEPDPEKPGKDIQAKNSYSAIKWAADHGAVIAQNSWSSLSKFKNKEELKAAKKEFALNGTPGYIKDAIDYFIKYAGVDEFGNQCGPMRGGIVLFSAGNGNCDWSIPGAIYPPIVTVAAIGPDLKRASYSNYGDWVDISAPGGSYDHKNGLILSTIKNNKYSYMGGTSMACPHVSGVAALIISYFGGMGFTNTMLTEMLLGGAKETNNQTGPLVDALGAFSFGDVVPPQKVNNISIDCSDTTTILSWESSIDKECKKAYGYILAVDDNLERIKDFDLKKPDERTICKDIHGTDKPIIKYNLENLEKGKIYFAKVIAYDYSHNYAEPSPIVKFQTSPLKYYMKVYPNPVKDIAIIETNVSNKILLKVCTPIGRIIYHTELYKRDEIIESKIDLSNYAPGYYDIFVSNKETTLKSRIVKL